MIAVGFRDDRPTNVPTGRPVAAEADRGVLEIVRRCARAAQLASPFDAQHECALIRPAPGHAAHVYGVALVRALDRAALRRLTFHPVGSDEISDGERWFLSLVGAVARNDEASVAFLVRRWVRFHDQRAVGFLAQRFGAGLAGLEDAAG